MVTVAELQALRQAPLIYQPVNGWCLSRKMVAELNIRQLLWMSLTGRSMMRSRYWGQPAVAVVRWE